MKNALTTTQIRNIAVEEMAKWGLIAKGWSFSFNNRRKSLGLCTYGIRRGMPVRKIQLSSFLLPAMTEADILDTIRHEIAHALDYDDRGTSDHSWRWQAWAIKVGADPSRTKNLGSAMKESGLTKKSKYTAICSNCGHETAYHRKWKATTRKSCGKCNPHRFDERYELTLKQNY